MQFKIFKFSKLGKKIVFKILLVGTIATTVFSSITFYIDYQRELAGLQKDLQMIKHSTAHSLSKYIWQFDRNGYEAQLKGLFQVSDLVKVVLRDESDNVLFKQEREGFDLINNIIKRSIPLTIDRENSSTHMGNLELYATKLNIQKKVFGRITTFITTQLFKTLILSFIFLAIFYYYVIKHLISITNFIQTRFGESQNNEEIILKKHGYEDEIDFLVAKINKLNKKTDELVEEHKAKSISVSRLAALGEMAGGIAHEINNPLTIIRGANQYNQKALTKEKPQFDKIYKNMTLIESTIDRISEIINGLRAVSRDSEKQVFSPVKLVDVLDISFSFCRDKLRNDGIDFFIKVEKELSEVEINCRSIQLSQVLLNLVNNACDAIEGLEHRWIDISVNKASDKININITDSGFGIPSEVVENIFNPFFTTKEIGKGTGLGLSISNSIIKDHEGELSYTLNEGHTCFVISLPIFINESQAMDTAIIAKKMKQNHSSQTTLQ